MFALNCLFVFCFAFLGEDGAKTIEEPEAIKLEEAEWLVAQMGDDSFETREKAFNRLITLIRTDEGTKLFPILEEAEKGKDPEIAIRAKLVIRKYYSVMPSKYPCVPRIDCLPADFPDREKIIRNYLRQVADFEWAECGKLQFRRQCRMATRFFCAESLSKGMKRSEVRAILDQMAEKEKAILKNSSE